MTDTTPAPETAPATPQPVVVNVTAPAAAPSAALPPKSTGTAYLMMLFALIGVNGVQHFYLGKVGRGVLWLLTFGLLGVGIIIDLFTLPSQVKTVNARRAVGIS